MRLMTTQGEARWWAMRGARNMKPATYTCPLCGKRLHAMSEHMLIAPEDDRGLRRHAHTACVVRARRAGRLALRDEVLPPRPSLLARWLRRA